MGMAYPTGAIVVPFGTSKPQSSPSRRTDWGCMGVAEGAFRHLAEGSQNAISLQIMVDRRGVEPLTSAVQTHQPVR